MKIYAPSECRQHAFTHNFLRVMRITLFLLVTIFVQISFASDAQQITLHKGVIPFEQAMQEIQKQTNYEFIYTDEMLAGTRPVTLNFNNASLEQVLHECFRGQPLTYFIRKSMIVLQRKPVSQKQMPLLSKALPSDTVTIIRGVVTDEKGVTLPGVSVQAKGTSSMTTTNSVFGKRIHLQICGYGAANAGHRKEGSDQRYITRFDNYTE